MNTRITLTILLLLISSLAFSQSEPQVNVQIKGVVTDSLTKETVPYATIKLLDKANPRLLLKAVAADENGKFQLSMNKRGDYLLLVEYIGKNTVTRPVTVGGTKTLDVGTIYMQDNDNALSEVVISAQKPLVKVDLDKIVYSIESDPESTTNNLLEMLKKVPMITVDGEDNVQLKGSTNFKIYLNGKPSNMISNNPKEVLRSMPANTVKDIQVITDPGAKYDAEGVAGIINIITNTSMGGYTATLNGRADTQGGFGLGAYMTMKYGKIGFTGNYNYYDWKQPKGENHSLTTYTDNDINKYLTRSGLSKANGNGQFGSGEISYEIDSLNLINVGFSRFEGRYKATTEALSEMLNIQNESQYKYEQNGYSKETYGGTDLNADYQRTFHKKDQLLTASYRLSISPGDSESSSDIVPVSGTLPGHIYSNRQYSDAGMNEHTIQVDFVTPLYKSDILSHGIETGVKYIIRINKSNSGLDQLDGQGNWIPEDRPNDKFRHEQDILSAYGGYNAKYRNVWGFKAGMRYEATWLTAEFPKATEQNFKVDYSNIVPSATVTYQINPTQNLRLGYNMRISRPGIWQLNPYVNTTDPSNVQKGNPGLDAVKNHSLSINYGLFTRNLNINANLYYGFENNGIEQITTQEGDIYTTTYENIGKRKNAGLYLNMRWTPKVNGDNLKWLEQLSINSNMGGQYIDIVANDGSGMKQNGFSGNIFGGIQYTFPKSWRFNANAGYFSPYISLQSENSSFFFHRFTLNKSFKNDRLNFSVYAQNPFKRTNEFKNKMNNQAYISESITTNRIQNFGISVSFRFGEMKSQIQKARRGITNDDTMSGGQGGGQGGQGGGQPN